MNDPRGSWWRKWDFHIHTPASFQWSGGKRFIDLDEDQKLAASAKTLAALNAADADAFVFMDYWTFDGYVYLRRYLDANPTEKLNKAVFPGIELRVEAPKVRLNLHVVLSDRLSFQQLQDFRTALRIPLLDKPLSHESLQLLYGVLTPDQIKAHGGNTEDPQERFRIGCETALVSRESIEKALADVREQALVYVPFDTYGGFTKVSPKDHPLLSTLFMRWGDIFEVHNARYFDSFHGVETDANAEFFESFMKALGGGAKPCVIGSDAHEYGRYGQCPVDGDGRTRYCWVKADPTFEGMLQLVNEPRRAWIGGVPTKLEVANANRTKYIRSLTICRRADSTLHEKWFDGVRLDFNVDLVAVIGNKGSGKSALADILGLLGGSKNESKFSFLHTEKFRNRRYEKASHFDATITWADGSTCTKRLSESVLPADVERVKYLPQMYIEGICNELRGGGSETFEAELEKVIFSWVPTDERLGKDSLDDLQQAKTVQIQETLSILREQLRKANQSIVDLEQKTTAEYLAGFVNQIKVKSDQLESHDQLKPKAPAPLTGEALESLKRTSEQTDGIRSGIADIEAKISKASAELGAINKLLTQLGNATAQIDNFERQYGIFKDAISVDLADLGLSFDELVQLSVNRKPLSDTLSVLQSRQVELRSTLDEGSATGLTQQKRELATKLLSLQAALDGPQKEQEAYKTALTTWQKGRDALVGDAETADTLEHLKAALVSLSRCPDDLTRAKGARLGIVRSIHQQIASIAQVYRDLYEPVQKVIKNHKLVNDRFNLSFTVDVQPRDFAETFLPRISRGVTGSFYGADEKMIRDIIAPYDFSKDDDVAAFVSEIDDLLSRNHRDPAKPAVQPHAQLRKGQTVEAMYEYLFSLSYLVPKYALRMSGKDLVQLSPGERGSLLLLFYLLVDKDDIPLIVDQPEENLDNQTVYKMLGECIIEAKQRRQIVIVTHNPNLAVACDAEQIICSDHDPLDGEKITYTAGAIENPLINQRLLDILEGTRPAFANRESKYLDSST